MLKWLGIAVVASIAFISVLLIVGYLLKENKIKTTALKSQFAQEQAEKIKSQENKSDKALNPYQLSQQAVILENLSCTSNSQCMLIETGDERLGCLISLNKTGAAILLKISGLKKEQNSTAKCKIMNNSATAVCINYTCQLK